MRLKPILMASVTTVALSGLSFTAADAARQVQQNQATNQNQQQQVTNQNGQNGRIDLVTWSQRNLYDKGWTAQQLFDKDVYGANGDQAGEVENLLIGPNGQIRSLIVESGGFLGIGDTSYAVPWNKVQFSQNMQQLTVPVTADNVSKFSVFQPDEQNADAQNVSAQNANGQPVNGQNADGQAMSGQNANAQPMNAQDASGQNVNRSYRATELIGDYVSLKDVRGYGTVRDLVFDNNGQLQAVVVAPDVGYGVGGPYAYPYYGYGAGWGWAPGNNYYNLPYSQSEISQLGPFDYSKLPGGAPNQGAMQQQTQNKNQ
jgi:sporulation protein YlmC with PRC-barrel domain